MLTGHVSALPRFLLLFGYMASVSVFVTFMTVMVFLAPITSYAQMLSGPDLYMHLVNPLLAVISYAFLLPGEALPFATTFFSLVPTVLYGILYIYKVLIKGEEKGGWSDFYTFNRNGAWPLSLILMLTGTYVLGLLLYFARSRFG